MKITLLCLMFSVPFVSCIIGGNNAIRHRRFAASLRNERRHHICGGAFIEVNFVLTAATCVKDIRQQDLVVVGGIINLNDHNGTEFHIDKIISKNPTGQNAVHDNIALLRLTKNLRPSYYLHPIAFEKAPEDVSDHDDAVPREGKKCGFVGWGQKDFDKPEVTNTLQEGETHISELSRCRSSNTDIDESNICTYDVKAGLCKFDTGDPLVSRASYYLWGIATDQHSCGGITDDVYTRVDKHKDWIKEVMNASTDHKPQIIALLIVVLLVMLLNY